MSESIPAQPDPDRAARAARLIEEDVARRKRVLRFYLGALIVPVAVGVYVLMTGKREEDEHREDHVVWDSVAGQVRDVGPAIARLNTLDTIALAQATAGIAQQAQRVRVIEQRQNDLQAQLTRVSSSPTVPDTVSRMIQQAVLELRSVNQRVTEQRRTIDAQDQEIRQLRDSVQVVARAVRPPTSVDPRVLARLTQLERRTDTLQRRTDALSRRTDSLRATVRPRGAGTTRPPTS